MKKYIFIVVIFLVAETTKALTVRSVLDADWSNPLTWSTGQVPSSPDSIIISNYVTFGYDLTINAPTVFVIESTGTICGDYLLNIACGAKWYNYGSAFINRFILRYGANYCTITTRGTSTVTGCPTGQWSVVPPKGNMNIVPWTVCKAPDTNWDSFIGITGGCTVGIKEYSIGNDISFYPNPVSDKLQIESAEPKSGSFSVIDISGRILKTTEEFLFKKTEVDLSGLTNGIYFVKVKTEEYTIIKKVIKD